jgi:hypothetical protein
MGCFFALFAGFFPRLAVLFIWLARPAIFNAALDPIFAILGIIFLPFTTLMYVLLWSATGLTGLDWLWLVLAFLLDVSAAGASAYNNRDRVPGYGNTGYGDSYKGG